MPTVLHLAMITGHALAGEQSHRKATCRNMTS